MPMFDFVNILEVKSHHFYKVLAIPPQRDPPKVQLFVGFSYGFPLGAPKTFSQRLLLWVH